ADKAGVVAVDLVLPFPAGEHDLLGIHDDDVVAIIDVGGVSRLVLATQPHRHDRSEPSDHQAGGVDQHPFLLDLGGLGRKGLHDTRFVRWRQARDCSRAGSYTDGLTAVNAIPQIIYSSIQSVILLVIYYQRPTRGHVRGSNRSRSHAPPARPH